MKECSNLCDLTSCFLCQRSLPDWLPAIAQNKKNFEIKKGQQIFKEADLVTGIFFVYTGTIKVHKRWDNQKEFITRFAGRGDIIGHLGLGHHPLYPVSATALEASVVCYVDLAFFESTLTVNTRLTYNLMQFFANELQESQRSMRNLAHMSVKARIAQAFISLKNQFGLAENGTIDLDLSRQDMASYAGTTYETLFKVINDLTRSGIVEASGKRVRILDEKLLLEIINQDNL